MKLLPKRKTSLILGLIGSVIVVLAVFLGIYYLSFSVTDTFTNSAKETKKFLERADSFEGELGLEFSNKEGGTYTNSKFLIRKVGKKWYFKLGEINYSPASGKQNGLNFSKRIGLFKNFPVGSWVDITNAVYEPDSSVSKTVVSKVSKSYPFVSSNISKFIDAFQDNDLYKFASNKKIKTVSGKNIYSITFNRDKIIELKNWLDHKYDIKLGDVEPHLFVDSNLKLNLETWPDGTAKNVEIALFKYHTSEKEKVVDIKINGGVKNRGGSVPLPLSSQLLIDQF